MTKVVYEVTEENLTLLAEQILKAINDGKKLGEDKYLTIEELVELIGYKKTSIYGLVQKRKIPYHKKGKLFFLKSEIMEWLKSGKKATSTDITKRANEYLLNTI